MSSIPSIIGHRDHRLSLAAAIVAMGPTVPGKPEREEPVQRPVKTLVLNASLFATVAATNCSALNDEHYDPAVSFKRARRDPKHIRRRFNDFTRNLPKPRTRRR